MVPTFYVNRTAQNWMPSLFREFFNDDFGFTPGKQFASPAVNVAENEKEYTLELAAPGMSKDDFKVRLENDDELTISLEKKSEDKKDRKNYLRREFSYASYRQTYLVPEDVEIEGIKATMNDGVLCVTLPKKEVSVKTPASRQIEIC